MADYKLKKVIRNGEEYLFETGDIQGLLPITNPTINGVAEHGKNCLCWDDPDDDSCRGTPLTCWTGTTLVRKEGSDPDSITDGVVVVTNTTRDQYASTYYSDGGLTNGCTYHYRVFANVSVGKPSCSSVICLTPTKGFDVDFLLIGGGGGGGGSCYYKAAGGGGAGGVIQCSKYQIGNIDTACVTIGAGGSSGYRGAGAQGCNSTFISSLFSFTAYGGGFGAGPGGCGGSGGSGGGGGPEYYGCGRGGSGVSGQGYSGGYGSTDQTGGSGGGAGGAGGSGSNYSNGPGGIGIISSIDGTSRCYAGGGGGGQGASYNHCGNNDGSYGGGNGGQRCGRGASSATTYGSGGGGSAGCGNYGGSGYQGIFIMRYNKNCGYDITGGCKYECGDYCIHCFISNGTLTFN